MYYRLYAQDKNKMIFNRNYNKDELFKALDQFILYDDSYKKILVIEHNDLINSDSVYYLFLDNTLDYLDFKEKNYVATNKTTKTLTKRKGKK